MLLLKALEQLTATSGLSGEGRGVGKIYECRDQQINKFSLTANQQEAIDQMMEELTPEERGLVIKLDEIFPQKTIVSTNVDP